MQQKHTFSGCQLAKIIHKGPADSKAAIIKLKCSINQLFTGTEKVPFIGCFSFHTELLKRLQDNDLMSLGEFAPCAIRRIK